MHVVNSLQQLLFQHHSFLLDLGFQLSELFAETVNFEHIDFALQGLHRQLQLLFLGNLVQYFRLYFGYLLQEVLLDVQEQLVHFVCIHHGVALNGASQRIGTTIITEGILALFQHGDVF